MNIIRPIILQDQQCQWCGGYEVIYCKPCDHMECDNCGAGGYCDCLVKAGWKQQEGTPNV